MDCDESLPEDETIQDIPPILNSTGRAVFHHFASMLDIKSYMKLAISCKEMYEMCTNDKMVKINVCHKSLSVTGDGGAASTFTFKPFDAVKLSESCLASLRVQNSLKELKFEQQFEFNNAKVMETRRFLEKNGIKSVEELWLCKINNLQDLAVFVEDFHVKELGICKDGEISEDMIRSILQWNLSSFNYYPPASFELFFNIDSPIPKFEFRDLSLSKEQFLQVLQKIENGRLCSVTMAGSDEDPFVKEECLAFNRNKELPVNRPLVFLNNNEHEYRILLKNGFVYSCGQASSWCSWPKISKCDPKDYPPLLKTKEQTFNGFKKKHKKFSCYKEDFVEYFLTLTNVPCNHEGALPEKRPLVFRDAKYAIWLLYEDGGLASYLWKNTLTTMTTFDLKKQFPKACRHSALTKYIFWRIVETAAFDVKFQVDVDTFRDAFKRFKTVSFQAFGDLPSERPLVFKNTELDGGKVYAEQRWLLREDGSMRKCWWRNGAATVTIGEPEEFPVILTKTLIKDFLMGKKFYAPSGLYIDRDFLNEYLKSYKILPFDDPQPLPDERPLLFQKTEIRHVCNKNSDDDCDCIDEVLHLCVVSEDNVVTKAIWGRSPRYLAFYESADVRDVPRMLRTKETLDYLIQGTRPEEKQLYWYGSLEDFLSYVKGHKMFDFNHKDRLPAERPLVFCQSSEYEEPTDFWFLRKDDVIVMCAWMKSYAELTFSYKNWLLPALCN